MQGDHAEKRCRFAKTILNLCSRDYTSCVLLQCGMFISIFSLKFSIRVFHLNSLFTVGSYSLVDHSPPYRSSSKERPAEFLSEELQRAPESVQRPEGSEISRSREFRVRRFEVQTPRSGRSPETRAGNVSGHSSLSVSLSLSLVRGVPTSCVHLCAYRAPQFGASRHAVKTKYREKQLK